MLSGNTCILICSLTLMPPFNSHLPAKMHFHRKVIILTKKLQICVLLPHRKLQICTRPQLGAPTAPRPLSEGIWGQHDPQRRRLNSVVQGERRERGAVNWEEKKQRRAMEGVNYHQQLGQINHSGAPCQCKAGVPLLLSPPLFSFSFPFLPFVHLSSPPLPSFPCPPILFSPSPTLRWRPLKFN